MKDKRSAVITGSLLLSPIFLYSLTAIWKQTVSLVIKDKRSSTGTISYFLSTTACCTCLSIVFVIFVVVYSDVDECTASSPVCDVNAICQNTRGSYSCTCKIGYFGDGKTCRGW